LGLLRGLSSIPKAVPGAQGRCATSDHQTRATDIIAGLEAGADDYLTNLFNRPNFGRLHSGERILMLEEVRKFELQFSRCAGPDVQLARQALANEVVILPFFVFPNLKD
jgi:hypothetical protein